jgi:hypothetical protein
MTRKDGNRARPPNQLAYLFFWGELKFNPKPKGNGKGIMIYACIKIAQYAKNNQSGDVTMSVNENILLQETNRGGYTLSIIAKFVEPIQYIIRVSKPKWKPKGTEVDFVSNLEGFKNIGELLIDLHHFAQEKLYAKDPVKLKEVLTAENIKKFVELKKAGRFSA